MRVDIKKSTRKDKKLMAIFSDNTVIHFGALGMSDYTIHKDPERKKRYLDRFKLLIEKNKDNPMSAITLSLYILWNKPSLRESIADYKKKFNLN